MTELQLKPWTWYETRSRLAQVLIVDVAETYAQGLLIDKRVGGLCAYVWHVDGRNGAEWDDLIREIPAPEWAEPWARIAKLEAALLRLSCAHRSAMADLYKVKYPSLRFISDAELDYARLALEKE